MVSHAHGQGYADFHFVIPETVEALRVYKGPYTAPFGDFATAGAGEFTTKTVLDRSQVKVEVGQFNTRRALVMVNLLGVDKHLLTKGTESAYLASEYYFTNSYFDNKQHFNRFNGLLKYTGALTDRTSLTLLGSHFNSRWDASGQVPERAVAEGLISRFGSIDLSEGATRTSPTPPPSARSGFGFHSNGARAVVQDRTANAVPRAIDYEVDSTFKPLLGMVVNVALWGLHLQDELIYVGDEGITESVGPSRRFGTDFSLRYQLTKVLFADADLNYNHGRLVGLPAGENYIPLAPRFTNTGGLTLRAPGGLGALHAGHAVLFEAECQCVLLRNTV